MILFLYDWSLHVPYCARRLNLMVLHEKFSGNFRGVSILLRRMIVLLWRGPAVSIDLLMQHSPRLK